LSPEPSNEGLDKAGLKIPRGLIDFDTQIIVKAKIGLRSQVALVQAALKKRIIDPVMNFILDKILTRIHSI
jgi:hypothetical protein